MQEDARQTKTVHRQTAAPSGKTGFRRPFQYLATTHNHNQTRNVTTNNHAQQTTIHTQPQDTAYFDNIYTTEQKKTSFLLSLLFPEEVLD